ncbi:MAG TPA: hypothetical protein DEW32_07585 [Dehalococcoidia bacterium]|nr:hypothetical protein [Dehalococcoidia bacterium]
MARAAQLRAGGEIVYLPVYLGYVFVHGEFCRLWVAALDGRQYLNMRMQRLFGPFRGHQGVLTTLAEDVGDCVSHSDQRRVVCGVGYCEVECGVICDSGPARFDVGVLLFENLSQSFDVGIGRSLSGK